MCNTDPARHPSLILIEALDLGQVSGRGALHLETLLGTKDSQRIRSRRYTVCRYKPLLPALVNTANRTVAVPTPLSVATTGTAQWGFYPSMCTLPRWALCTFWQLCLSEGTGMRGLHGLFESPAHHPKIDMFLKKWILSYLITDQFPLFFIVILTQQLQLIWRQVHGALKNRAKRREKKIWMWSN